jgi:hypothetical protein
VSQSLAIPLLTTFSLNDLIHRSTAMRENALANTKTQDAIDKEQSMWSKHKVDCRGETLDSRCTDRSMSSSNQGTLCM